MVRFASPQYDVVNHVANACFYGVECSLRLMEIFGHIERFNQGYQLGIRLFKIPRYADVESIRMINFFVFFCRLAFPLLRTIRDGIVLHRPIALATSIQSWMSASACGFVTRVQKSVQFIACRLLDANDQEPSIPLEIGNPFETLELEVKGADC
jgi:hypothetical protein